MLRSTKITAIILSALLFGTMAAGCSQTGEAAESTLTKTVTSTAAASTVVSEDSSVGSTLEEVFRQNGITATEDSTDTASQAEDSTSGNQNKPSPSAGQSSTAAQSDNTTVQSDSTATQKSDTTAQSDNTAVTMSSSGKLDTSDLFSSRDLKQEADTSEAKTITAADNKTETITEEGVYLITGSASNFTVKVEADKEAKVQLVLDGLTVTNDSFPVIYVVSADKCFITTTSSSSTLSVTGTFTADGDTSTDAVIYSKDDLVFNGTGSLVITSAKGNGISGKDDIKFTGGSYTIQSALDSVEANDSISVYAGSFNITSGKDGFHSENSDDDTVGWVYLYNGTFSITASSDAIQATTVLQIDGGTLNLTGSEGLEATYVQINGGDITISASDDGINAANKSRSIGTPTVEINDGNLSVTVGQGDTDAIDANGNIIVNGGTINITATMSSFDYDGTAQYNGGTIIINGTQVDSIPQSMMGGGMGGRGGMGDMGGMGGRGGMGF